MKLDRRWVATALPLGPALLLVGYVGLTQTQAPITDATLIGLLVYPTVAVLLGAVVTTAIRRDPTVWVSMAVGVTLGALVLAIVVGGGISALAWMLSDPS
jgi:hypothetical protein